MKKFTFTKKMAMTAMSFGLFLGVSAQTMSKFDIVLSQDPSDSIRAAYRNMPSFGDFNNDGWLDIYYGGQAHGIPNQDWIPTSMLLKNISGTSFERIEGAWAQESQNGIPINSFSNTVFFDYNNDGYLDVIIQSGKEWGIDDGGYCQLYKNTGPEGNYKFELVPEAVFVNTDYGNEKKAYASIAVGDLDKDGYMDIGLMVYDKEGSDDDEKVYRMVNLYRNNGGDGTFTLLEFDAQLKNPVYINKQLVTNHKGLAPMSKGTIVFGDLNNDGLLDIVINGWVDGNPEGVQPELKGGPRTKIYKNVDGLSFIEVTPDDFIGDSYDSEIKLADFNKDGYLDIFITGEGNPSGRHASLFENVGDGTFNFEFTDYASLGLRGVTQSNLLVADLNNDGRLDIVTNGWVDENESPDGNSKLLNIYYRRTSGDFTLDTSYPIVSCNEGGMAFGDINNDNALDVMVSGWLRGDRPDGIGDANTPIVLYKNDPSIINPNEAPSAPGNLEAKYNDGILTVNWSESTDDYSESALVYNVYLKNKQTGEIFMMVPADLETGRLKATAYTQIGTRMLNYTMSKTITQPGDYEVGVQAIDQACVGGLFSTTILEGENSIGSNNKSNISVTMVEGGISVDADYDAVVSVFDISGRIIYNGDANSIIPVSANGIYVVNVSGQIFKVIK